MKLQCKPIFYQYHVVEDRVCGSSLSKLLSDIDFLNLLHFTCLRPLVLMQNFTKILFEKKNKTNTHTNKTLNFCQLRSCGGQYFLKIIINTSNRQFEIKLETNNCILDILVNKIHGHPPRKIM